MMTLPDGNLYSNVPSHLPEELTESLREGDNFRIERIVSHGHRSALDFWYDQEECEWVVLLRGSATLEFEEDGSLLHLTPGDWVNIPAHRRHRVAATADSEPTIWLAVFTRS